MNKLSYIATFCVLTFILTSHSISVSIERTKTVKPLEHDIALEMIEPIQPIDIAYNEDVNKKTKIIEVSETTETVKIDAVEKELLACVIYQEAGSDLQCDECRRRVADVVLNRVESDLFPDTIHQVLTQEYQYGLYYYTGVVWPDRVNNPNEAEAVERAYRIAEEVLSGNHSDLYGKDYIWQAEFSQGINVVNCCGIYFGQFKKEV